MHDEQKYYINVDVIYAAEDINCNKTSKGKMKIKENVINLAK